MKKFGISFLLVTVFLMQGATILVAASASDAKTDWLAAKQVSKTKQSEYQDAKAAFAGDNSEANKAELVSVGKELLHAALDEVEAWLLWKDAEVDGNPEIPASLKSTISDDVQTNLSKIDALRVEVDGIDNPIELGLVFLKMIGKYFELSADVARNWGKVLVFLGGERIDKAEELEAKLRDQAEGLDDSKDILASLDEALDDLAEAQGNVNKAEGAYNKVTLPGTPLIKFAEGNGYLNTARTNLFSAHANLSQAYILIITN